MRFFIFTQFLHTFKIFEKCLQKILFFKFFRPTIFFLTFFCGLIFCCKNLPKLLNLCFNRQYETTFSHRQWTFCLFDHSNFVLGGFGIRSPRHQNCKCVFNHLCTSVCLDDFQIVFWHRRKHQKRKKGRPKCCYERHILGHNLCRSCFFNSAFSC